MLLALALTEHALTSVKKSANHLFEKSCYSDAHVCLLLE